MSERVLPAADGAGLTRLLPAGFHGARGRVGNLCACAAARGFLGRMVDL